MSSVTPRLKWIGGAYLEDDLRSVAVKFTTKNGQQYGAYEMVRSPSDVCRAVERLTAQMQVVADIMEAQS